MGREQPWSGRAVRRIVRRFVVAEDSMRPTLEPGDGLLARRSATVRRGQLRVFEHPARPGFWLIKRVGHIDGTGPAATFEAVSDNPSAPGAVDSRRLGPIPVAGSYRVVRVFRATAVTG